MNKQKQIIKWTDYNNELKNRGRITIWLAPGFQKNWYNKTKTGAAGASDKYTTDAMNIAFQLRNRYGLTLRSTQGFLASIFELLGIKLDVPDYTTICRRLGDISSFEREGKPSENVHVVLDSTGLKIYGEGEWKVRTHGYSKRRTWRKLHLAVNESTNEILAVLLTGNDKKDSEVITDLLNQIPDDIAQVSADGAYDAKNCYDVIESRDAIATIPPKKGSVIHEHGNLKSNSRPIRDEHIRHRRTHGKAIWKIDTMYSRRSLAETAMFRFKIIFGGNLRSRSFKNQTAEAILKCQILNQFKTPSIL